QMKLVTICKNWSGMTPEYTPGKCNIGSRGRAIRLSTGAVLIALSVILGVTALIQVVWVVRLALVLPLYVGRLAALDGSTVAGVLLRAGRIENLSRLKPGFSSCVSSASNFPISGANLNPCPEKPYP